VGGRVQDERFVAYSGNRCWRYSRIAASLALSVSVTKSVNPLKVMFMGLSRALRTTCPDLVCEVGLLPAPEQKEPDVATPLTRWTMRTIGGVFNKI